MTFLPPEGPLPELSTTRVAGGSSARLVAVGVVGVLIAVVGFTVINRPPAPAPIAAALPTASPGQPPAMPTPTPPRNQLEGNDGIFGWPVVSQLPLIQRPATVLPARSPTYSYAASMLITGGLLRVALTHDVAEEYRGSVVIASTDVGSRLQLELGREWVQNGLTIFESFATWQVPLKALRRSRGGQVTLLVEFVPPNSTPSTARAVASGYTFTVMGKRDRTSLNLYFDLIWPASSQAARYFGPRNPGTFNRCRWDYGPLAAAPHGNTDEAGCLS